MTQKKSEILKPLLKQAGIYGALWVACFWLSLLAFCAVQGVH